MQPPRIERMLRNGQSIIVQVTKNPIAHKGARLTQEVSLAGRFVVMVPGQPQTYGISKRLPDDERKRLRRILDKLRPSDAGLIVRTAAEGATDDELERDLRRLNGQWQQISELAKKAKPGSLLYKEPPLAIRLIREEFTKEYRGVVIDAPTLYEEVSSYVEAIAPELADRIEQYDAAAENLPLFEKFHVHEQLHKALDRKVWLPSGGSLVIERTEALTVIDVNTGKNVGTSNLEETVYRNNLEAAEAVARELRLRDIGGIIVIDFIDMEIKCEPRSSRGSVPPGARARQDAHAGVLDLRARPARDDTQARVRRVWSKRSRRPVRTATGAGSSSTSRCSSSGYDPRPMRTRSLVGVVLACVSCSPRAVATTTTAPRRPPMRRAATDQAPADAAIAAFAHEAEDQGFTAGRRQEQGLGERRLGERLGESESEACKQFSDGFRAARRWPRRGRSYENGDVKRGPESSRAVTFAGRVASAVRSARRDQLACVADVPATSVGRERLRYALLTVSDVRPRRSTQCSVTRTALA